MTLKTIEEIQTILEKNKPLKEAVEKKVKVKEYNNRPDVKARRKELAYKKTKKYQRLQWDKREKETKQKVFKERMKEDPKFWVDYYKKIEMANGY